LIALGIGLLVGLEREWARKDLSPDGMPQVQR